MSYILAIDQGTSSTKSLIFNDKGEAMAKGVEELFTHYLADGFVEQDPEEIYRNVTTSVTKCIDDFIAKGFSIDQIKSIGISNQRETFVLWDESGKPLYNAVVWQCKRSVKVCEAWKQKGWSDLINNKTGLVIDPYFSASKLVWLNENKPDIATAIREGKAYFGTIDTWLLYKLTGGKVYRSDYTNASRTMLFNIHTLQWDEELINIFGLNGLHLPSLQSSSANYGETDFDGYLSQPINIGSMIGDSHAAAFGEGCFDTGTAKATLGTGCSILMNIGDKPVNSNNGMVTTICWSAGDRVDYAFEGVIVTCGATIEWLRQQMKLIQSSKDTAAIAQSVPDNAGVYLVPAFSGLGSPHWDMDRKASITGMTFDTTVNHVVRAALESIPYQIKDVVVAMEKDAGITLKELNADGGITANEFVIRFLTDLLERTVATIGMPDVSALGAAYLAGLQSGIFTNIDSLRQLNSGKKYYQPAANEVVLKGYEGWQAVIEKK